MEASVEISLYPLNEEYKDIILGFLYNLSKHRDLIIETNYMSTHIFGDYDRIFEVIKDEMRKVYSEHRAVLVMNIVGVNLKKE